MKPATAVTPAGAHGPAELVGRMQTGDASAWRDLIDQYEPLLRWLARKHRLSAEDTEDAVQLTWLRCLEHLDQLRDPDRLRAWLMTICRRESVRLATRRRREAPLGGPEVARLIDERTCEADPCAEAAVRRDRHDRLHAAIAALPRRQRDVLVALLRQEGQGYLGVSRQLNLPVGSLGPTRQRALTRLRSDPALADVSPGNSNRHVRTRSA